jgi:ABC-type Fe3+-hydroxamate transport system substrate-binding protein
MRKITATVAGIAAMAALLTGCNSRTSSVSNDQKATNNQLDKFEKNQPIPQSDWSQYRQTLIDVEQAQVHGVATTTFFYNMGSNVPVKSCPSIGFPVPTTSQLTNPEQVVTKNGNPATVGQSEPNGTYTGDSSGTYVVCVADGGAKYVTYWEGSVETEGGPAHYDKASGQIVLDGQPTVITKTK